MAAIGFVVAYAALVSLSFWRARNATSVVLGVGLIAALLGSAVQIAVALGVTVNLLGLQLLLLIALAGLLAYSWMPGRSESRIRMRVSRRQRWLLVVPSALIAALLLILRATAWTASGPMTGMAFLDAQSNTQDGAHWLNIASQLASGDALWLPDQTFAGPMLVLLTVSTTLAAAISQIVLGGVNEVAIAVNGVVLASLMLIAASPLALAPLAERRVRGPRAFALAAGVLFGVVILAMQSATIVATGNLSMQFALWAMVLWVASFFTSAPMSTGRVAGTIIAIGAATVWPSLAPLGLLLLFTVVVTGIQAMRKQRWDASRVALVAASVVLLPFPLLQSWSALTSGVLESASPTLRYTPDLAWLLLLAVASALGAAKTLSSTPNAPWRAIQTMAPLGALATYAVVLVAVNPMLTRATLTSSAADVLAVTMIVTIAVTSGVTLLAFTDHALAQRASMIAAAALVFAITIGGIAPGSALALIAGKRGSDDSTLGWARAAEVQQTSTQPISTMPIGCVFLPQGAPMPTGQPDPELTYRCTRLLVALHGLNGRSDSVLGWMDSERGTGGLWNYWHANLAASRDAIASKTFLVLDHQSAVIGYESLRSLVERFPPTP